MLGVGLVVLVAAAGPGERVVKLPAFHAVELATDAMLTVEAALAPAAGLVLRGDPRLVRCVTAEVRDGRLLIGWAGRVPPAGSARSDGADIIVEARSGCPRTSNAAGLSILATAPVIDDVVLRTRGTVRVAPMRVPTFAARLAGRGTMALAGLEAGVTRIEIGGIGRITASGALGQLAVTIGGDGRVDTSAARATALRVNIAGKGTVAAQVDGPATGTVAGSGIVTVGGRPDCAIRITGRGRIDCPAPSRSAP